jgi:hypothetical protein
MWRRIGQSVTCPSACPCGEKDNSNADDRSKPWWVTKMLISKNSNNSVNRLSELEAFMKPFSLKMIMSMSILAKMLFRVFENWK